eukprot:Partr_v1_DN16839_c0_g1_i1_m28286 putative Component of the eukaryotic translation initiation factor 3 (eIF-3) complex, which is involved in protein synthesis and, together with other initiation factors, stimulates binding of mRNA and methionyl-tRNAi to the 40S ribosome (By similarity)
MAGLAVYDIAPPEDRLEELCQLVGGDGDLLNALKPRVEAGDYAGIVRELLENHQEAFKAGSDEDVEGLFVLLFSFLKDIEPAALGPLAERLAAVIASSSADLKAAPARLRALANLYNSLSDATHKAEKLGLLRSVIRFASDTRQLEALAPLFAGAAGWKAKWGLTEQEARALYLLISVSLEKAGDAEQAQAFLIRYLATYEGDVGAIDDEALARAKDAAVGYVKAPAVSQRSALPQLAVVKALSNDARYSALYSLLTIFSSGTLEQYHEFAGKHGDLIASLKLDGDKSLETMRLFTLVSLAGGAQVLDFGAVATALQIPASEVEPWVVRAVTRGLLDARVDQAAGT